MNRTQIYTINKQRLTRWLHRCTEAHATALILVGIIHEPAPDRPLILTTENGPTDQEILLFLKEAVSQLEKEIISRN